ncbi:hypothetical protein K0M31_004757 [Melipona bicolor]|uniref:Uncharacterized protein n=1 Tax=Melipona bicolor TaxID=60889 RepID=A0AA40KN17_9HYME|nr:hypothetical protein K0M31_004757 [Melipona bicolor]
MSRYLPQNLLDSSRPSSPPTIALVNTRDGRARAWCSRATPRDSPCQAAEPIGFKSPIFSNDLSSTAYSRREGMSVVLACSAQGFPVPTTSERRKIYRCFGKWDETRMGVCFVEPVGFKSPIFSSDDSLSKYARRQGTSVVLACSAQGFPVPTTRTGGSKVAAVNVGRSEPYDQTVRGSAHLHFLRRAGKPCAHH